MQFVGDKVGYALSQGLKAIACIGETLEQRESGSTVAVVAAQTKAIAGTVVLFKQRDSHVHYVLLFIVFGLVGLTFPLSFILHCSKKFEYVTS